MYLNHNLNSKYFYVSEPITFVAKYKRNALMTPLENASTAYL